MRPNLGLLAVVLIASAASVGPTHGGGPRPKPGCEVALVAEHDATAREIHIDRQAKRQPECLTFGFLAFTHSLGRSRRGGRLAKRKTAEDGLRRAFQALSEWHRKKPHKPIEAQDQALEQKLQGRYGYYAITGNFASLQNF
jgi:hypothetical protein